MVGAHREDDQRTSSDRERLGGDRETDRLLDVDPGGSEDRGTGTGLNFGLDAGGLAAHIDNLSGATFIVDGDGDLDIVLGGAYKVPFKAPEALMERWRKYGPSILILRNQLADRKSKTAAK